jgi:2-polyprenyl-6-methoxyphenol hydroxylase-like FAD-dependent oxidoreductase
VGDAGLTDPCTAAGINNAFRDVEMLVKALDDGLSGRRPMPEALADYHFQRDAASTPIYKFACQLAPLSPPPPE